MAEPLYAPRAPRIFPGAPDDDQRAPSPRWYRRARRAARGWLRAVLGWAVRPARLLPGVAAVGCAVAGTWLLWGLGWALLAAVPFLLVLDYRTPGG